MSQLKLAILGAGRIAETMAETVRQMDDVCLYAVAAREEARAKAFAETYGAEHYYGSYEEMLQDDGVELVYIATPHSHHAQHAKLCIEYGRPVPGRRKRQQKCCSSQRKSRYLSRRRCGCGICRCSGC